MRRLIEIEAWLSCVVGVPCWCESPGCAPHSTQRPHLAHIPPPGQSAAGPRLPVGECLVGRHGSGVAVERCAVLGVGRVGSVLLPGFCVVGRWI
eukprot:scaffold17835_cov129-Isochrysis_galbana.AAC.6